MEKVSIIIVNFNGLKWLDKLLNSLFSQTYKNIEIIFVDNNSTDGSVQYIKQNYNYDNLKIIESKKNLGFAGGNNLGIKNSSSNHILLLNNDTWVEKNFVEDLYKFFSQHNYDVVAPYEASYDGKVSELNYKITIDLFGFPYYSIRKGIYDEGFYLSGVSLFFKKKFYIETGGLDDSFFMYFEEIDWFWRLNLYNKTYCHVPDVYVYHNVSGSSENGISYLKFLWRNQNILQMLLKNYSFYSLIIIIPFYILQNLIEMIFFFLTFKFMIVLSYIEGWYFNLKNLSNILKRRKLVQDSRAVSDLEIFKKIYFGSSKARSLISYYLKKIKNEKK